MQRRIATREDMIPVQERSVDPFSRFNSDIVNKITRITSYGNDIIIDGLTIEISNDKIIKIKPGYAIKDDCLVNITNNLTNDEYAIKLDLSKENNWIDCKYYDSTDFYNFNTIPCIKITRKAYVILYYSYYKNPRPNISYIGLVTEEKYLSKDFSNDCIVLAELELSSPFIISSYKYHDNRKDRTKFLAKDVKYNCYDSNIWNKKHSIVLAGESVDTISKCKTIPSNVQDCLTYLATLILSK